MVQAIAVSYCPQYAHPAKSSQAVVSTYRRCARHVREFISCALFQTAFFAGHGSVYFACAAFLVYFLFVDCHPVY